MLTDVARGLGVAEPALKAALTLVQPDGAVLGQEFIRRLGAELTALPHRFACFLDDLHALSTDVGRDIGRLISLVADENHRFVVASRTEPPWPIQRWRVSGFTDIVVADDLRLTSTDIADLIGPDFVELVPRTLEITKGWAAAVEAVRWRLQASPSLDLEDVVDSGSPRSP